MCHVSIGVPFLSINNSWRLVFFFPSNLHSEIHQRKERLSVNKDFFCFVLFFFFVGGRVIILVGVCNDSLVGIRLLFLFCHIFFKCLNCCLTEANSKNVMLNLQLNDCTKVHGRLIFSMMLNS